MAIDGVTHLVHQIIAKGFDTRIFSRRKTIPRLMLKVLLARSIIHKLKFFL
jgi:hypothetical protein